LQKISPFGRDDRGDVKNLSENSLSLWERAGDEGRRKRRCKPPHPDPLPKGEGRRAPLPESGEREKELFSPEGGRGESGLGIGPKMTA